MFEIDMTRKPESELLVGTHLWMVTSVAVEKARNNCDMVVIEFKCGNSKLVDRIMLDGRGLGIGIQKLGAFGVAPDFKGKVDGTKWIGMCVWVATVRGTFKGIDKKTGKPRTYERLEVDISQLANAGLQRESDVPPGCSASPSVSTFIEETPF